MYQTTIATKKIHLLNKRIRAIQGGTSASKTISILLLLIAYAQRDTTPTLTSIVAESFPHLRRGAIRDFLDIMVKHNYYKDALWNKTESTYTFESGSKIEFFSADQDEKLRGARRERLFLNECNNISFSAFNELEVRTNEFIFLDWNPTNEFWYYTELAGKRPDIDHLIITYKDNEALNPEIIKSIELRKNNKSWWQVYGLGLLGTVEGLIYRDWKIVDEVPHEARLLGYGLDYGYTNDPTAICALYYYNGGYVIHEVAYTKGLSNKQIADILLALPAAPVYPDSAEPKSNDELRLYKLTVMPVTKGKGSVSQGIAFVQAQRISITKSSVNFIKDYRNYMWEVDNDGNHTNVPEHQFSHGMDAVRYVFQCMKHDGGETKAYEQPAYEAPGIGSGPVGDAPSTGLLNDLDFTPKRRES